jgi:hypothetical protein
MDLGGDSPKFPQFFLEDISMLIENLLEGAAAPNAKNSVPI